MPMQSQYSQPSVKGPCLFPLQGKTLKKYDNEGSEQEDG